MALGGLSIQILTPIKGQGYPRNSELSIEFTITQACGCPLCFNKPKFAVDISLFPPKGAVKKIVPEFDSNLGMFKGKVTPDEAGEYLLYVRAVHTDSGMAGESKLTFKVLS